MERAHECEKKGVDEYTWNMEVHHWLLRWVLREAGLPSLVDFVGW